MRGMFHWGHLATKWRHCTTWGGHFVLTFGGFIDRNWSQKGVEIGDTQQMNDTMDTLLFNGDPSEYKNLKEEGVKTTIGIHVNDSMGLNY
jgi:hypothetical protein